MTALALVSLAAFIGWLCLMLPPPPAPRREPWRHLLALTPLLTGCDPTRTLVDAVACLCGLIAADGLWRLAGWHRKPSLPPVPPLPSDRERTLSSLNPGLLDSQRTPLTLRERRLRRSLRAPTGGAR
jgi:hypothetical protein